MPADPRDDFRAFADHEHMFFGLHDPYRMIREELLEILRRQVPDSVLDGIVVRDQPKFLTIGKKTDDAQKVIVAHFGFCISTLLAVSHAGGTRRDRLPATATFLFGQVDRPGAERMQIHLDLAADAEPAFDDTVFQDRLRAFRASLA